MGQLVGPALPQIPRTGDRDRLAAFAPSVGLNAAHPINAWEVRDGGRQRFFISVVLLVARC